MIDATCVTYWELNLLSHTLLGKGIAMQLEEKGYKGPCPECGSSDAKHFYPDGQTHCYKCEHHTFPKENKMSTIPLVNN